MKALGGVLLVLVLATGCSSGAGASASDPPSKSPSPKIRTLAEVAKAACGDQRVVRNKPDELEWFTSAGATCGRRTTIALFDGPGGLEPYAEMVKANHNRILVGDNWVIWIDTWGNAKEYARIQRTLGGKVEGPG